jgi:4-amino-4-deoxy-L-arabinose transferase-like glycosyltransferase
MQKKSIILLILLLIGAGYFLLFGFPNATGARDFNMTFIFEKDEPAQYPHVVRMLEPGKTISQTIYRFFAYQHYYFGFPYYLLSALVLLPFKLLGNWENVSLNMLLLRQFISVLPMLAAIIILVYLQTKFQSYLKSILLFLILLAVPGVVFNDMWIHPDSLVFLFIVLTFFFLDRDDLQFGRNYFLAGLFCGLAVATKLIGLFFFLAIPFYIFLGWRRGRIDTRKMFTVAVLFVTIMLATFVLANPFLFWASERTFALKTQTDLHNSMSGGFIVAYHNSPLLWLQVIEKWYGLLIFVLLALIALLIAVFKGERRLLNQLILIWAFPFMVYISFSLVIRPKHFPLPILLPIFSALPAYFTAIAPQRFSKPFGDYIKKNVWRLVLCFVGVVIVGAQMIYSLRQDVSLYKENLHREENSRSLKFYSRIEQDYLSRIVLDRPLIIFRDVMMYIPNLPIYEDYFKWGVSNYDIAFRHNPDLLILNKQHLYDYTQPGQVESARNKDFVLTVQFYKDVLNGTVKGYVLLYEDDFGIVYLSAPLYNQFMTSQ